MEQASPSKTLPLIAATLQLLDLSTTILGLELGAQESNPVMAGAIGLGGYALMALIKIIAAVASYWVSLKSKTLAWVLIAFYTVVVVNNSIQLYHALSYWGYLS